MNINRLTLRTNDLNGTIAFYKHVLELETLVQTDVMVSFAAGKTALTFICPYKEQHPVYHFAFTIPHNKLNEAFDYIRKRTAIMDIPGQGNIADFSNWNAEAFYFYDNNGNILEFIVRYDLDNSIPQPFNSKAIYAISEIGLVTDDVPALLHAIEEKCKIPVFAQQPPQGKFAVMGNNEGLLILVANERPWYPTRVKAKPFPVMADITHEGKRFELVYPFN